ncbi:hypothetical protein HAX54_003445 [Datura stramonium]|uniref:Uncharacterized protein n=1 Tax=Datura stramonium TaxID=4076 RepID=A0ABS8T650_DATST|nr:hypothetical protein [Datura stramonium]
MDQWDDDKNRPMVIDWWWWNQRWRLEEGWRRKEIGVEEMAEERKVLRGFVVRFRVAPKVTTTLLEIAVAYDREKK